MATTQHTVTNDWVQLSSGNGLISNPTQQGIIFVAQSVSKPAFALGHPLLPFESLNFEANGESLYVRAQEKQAIVVISEVA